MTRTFKLYAFSLSLAALGCAGILFTTDRFFLAASVINIVGGIAIPVIADEWHRIFRVLTNAFVILGAAHNVLIVRTSEGMSTAGLILYCAVANFALVMMISFLYRVTIQADREAEAAFIAERERIAKLK